MAKKKNKEVIDVSSIVAAGMELKKKGFQLKISEDLTLMTKSFVKASFIDEFGQQDMNDAAMIFVLIREILDPDSIDDFDAWVEESGVPMETITAVFKALFAGIAGKDTA